MERRLPFPEIARRADELEKCVTCGLCQAVCPTYLVEGFEGLTARGKIVLMRGLLEGTLEPSPSLADLFDDCLSCYACQTVCPAGVRTQRLWIAARQDLAPGSVKGILRRIAIRWTIGSPRLFENVIHFIGSFAGYRADERRGPALRPAGLPIFRGAPHLRHLEEEYSPAGEEVGSVALLIGCTGNITAPNVVDATVKLLRSAGYRVVIPQEQVCCGAPAINNGDWKTARRLARHTIELFGGLDMDHVTSPDGTCASAMAHDYLELFAGDADMLDEAKRFSSRIIDLGKLLADAVRKGRLHFERLPIEVTLHDSCHVTHTWGGSCWRELLGAVDGLVLREMRESDHCCGFGGSYQAAHRKTSRQIARRKLARAGETGAETVLVGSPGCLIRLQSVASGGERGGPTVRHAVELLAEALQ